MTATKLHHVTVTTGHTRTSPRSDVRAEALAKGADMLTKALSGQAVDLFDGLEFRAWCDRGEMLEVEVSHEETGETVLHFAVSARPDPDGWAEQSTDPEPTAPWIAVVPEHMALAPEAALWLGDFERSIAWAWIERDKIAN